MFILFSPTHIKLFGECKKKTNTKLCQITFHLEMDMIKLGYSNYIANKKLTRIGLDCVYCNANFIAVTFIVAFETDSNYLVIQSVAIKVKNETIQK